MHAATSLRLALFYAATFVVFGVQVPFWPVWLSARGLSAAEIGALLAIGQWVRAAAIPFAGIAADRTGDSRRIMLVVSIGAAVGFVLCLPAQGFAALLVLNAATGACLSALGPLGDNVALTAAYAGKLDYGRVRLWGSLSFILTSVLTGWLLDGRGGDIVVYLLIAGAALTFASCLTLPSAGPAVHRAGQSGWRALLTPRFLAFLGAAALVQGSHSVFYVFSALHWRSLGLADTTVALLWSEGVVAEIVLFFWGMPLLRRVGPLGLIALGGGAGLVRWTVTAFTASVPVLALAQLLHAFTFAGTYLGAMHHLARTVPAERAATGQAVYATVAGAIGPALMLLAGSLYESVGGLAYLVMAAIAAVGAAIALGLAGATSRGLDPARQRADR